MSEQTAGDNYAERTPRQLLRSRLGRLTREVLHNAEWIDVNRRFHDVTIAVRIYANDRRKVSAVEEAAFIDGATFALREIGRASDMAIAEEIFARPTVAQETKQHVLPEAS